MSILRRIAKNSTVLIINKVITTLISVGVSICFIRYLGSEGYGKYSVVFAYLSFFQILTNLGIDSIIVREVSRDNSRADKLIGNGILMKLALSAFAISASWAVLQFLGYPVDVKIFVYVASLGMIFTFSQLFNTLFQVHLKMIYPVTGEIIITFISSGLTLLLIYLKATIIQFIFLQVFLGIPILVVEMYISRRYSDLRPRFQINFPLWQELLRESWPIALTAFFSSIYVRIDQVMLFKMLGGDALGQYSAAVKLTEYINIIPIAFVSSVFPLMSSYYKDSKDSFKKVYELSFKYLLLIIIPIAVGVTLLSKQFTLLIYGLEFFPSAIALSILIWSEVFVFIGIVHQRLLIASGLQRVDFLFTSTSAFVNIVLNLLLIPKYGIAGAAIATVISYGIGVPFSYFLKKTRKFAKAILRSMIKPTLASVLMGCLLYFLPSLPIIIDILVCGIVYLALMIGIKGLNSEDIRYFKQIVIEI